MIEVKNHFLREKQERGEIEVEYINTRVETRREKLVEKMKTAREGKKV